MAMRLVELRGTPLECGRRHGALLQDAIRVRLEAALGARFPGHDRSEVLEAMRPRLAAFEQATRQASPHLLDEMRGIAEGADLGSAEVLLLNAFEVFDELPPALRAGCTAVAAATTERTLVAQNWDGTDRQAASLVVLRIERADGLRQLLLASAGGLGWAGMNSHGVGLVNNDLLLTSKRVAAPSQVIRRLVLEQRTVADALRVLREVPSPGGRSYVLGDRGGHLAVVEVSAARAPVIREPERVAWHANHVESAELAAEEDRAALARVYPSSHARDHRARDLVSRLAVPGPDDVAALLRDHEGLPLSVCKHESGEEPLKTVASVIFDLTGRVGRFALAGPPCATEYAAVPC